MCAFHPRKHLHLCFSVTKTQRQLVNYSSSTQHRLRNNFTSFNNPRYFLFLLLQVLDSRLDDTPLSKSTVGQHRSYTLLYYYQSLYALQLHSHTHTHCTINCNGRCCPSFNNHHLQDSRINLQSRSALKIVV